MDLACGLKCPNRKERARPAIRDHLAPFWRAKRQIGRREERGIVCWEAPGRLGTRHEVERPLSRGRRFGPLAVGCPGEERPETANGSGAPGQPTALDPEVMRA